MLIFSILFFQILLVIILLRVLIWTLVFLALIRVFFFINVTILLVLLIAFFVFFLFLFLFVVVIFIVFRGGGRFSRLSLIGLIGFLLLLLLLLGEQKLLAVLKTGYALVFVAGADNLGNGRPFFVFVLYLFTLDNSLFQQGLLLLGPRNLHFLKNGFFQALFIEIWWW